MYSYENFISYRRLETMTEVKMIYDALVKEGYPTFCDIFDLPSGNYQENLLNAIDCCTNFILVLAQTTLDLCTDCNDWLYCEIREALKLKKNIICVFVGKANFPSTLPLEIQDIRWQNGISFDITYFTSFIDRLISHFLAADGISLRSDVNRDFVIENNTLVKYVGSAKFVTIPDGIEVIGRRAFKDASKVETLTFPASVTEIQESAFERCTSLSQIVFPPLLHTIKKRAFYRCHFLAYALLNDELKSIEEEAFAFCDRLRTIQITPMLRKISSSAFNSCSQLAQFIVPPSNYQFSDIDGILYDYNQTELIRCPENYRDDIVNVPDSVRVLGPWAFSGCSNLVNVILPTGLNKIMAFAFYDCINITSLSLPDSVTHIDISALDDWHYPQRVIMGKNFNPRIRYNIENKLRYELGTESSDVSEHKYTLIRTTFESKHEAINMTKMLLTRRLIAVGQISAIHSIYNWEKHFTSEEEVALWCITESKLRYKVENFIKSHHSFDLCEFMSIPVSYVSEEFGDWISEDLEDFTLI